MHEHIGKDDVVYYVGAELGEFPALLQKWGAEVVLIEPNHSAWPVIKAVWDANKLERPLGIHAMFASDVTELEPTKPDKGLYNGEGWKLDEDNWPKYAKGEINEAHGFSELHNERGGLPQVKIDDIAAYTKGPTAISIDVEGSEAMVLYGAENTLLTYRPKIFMSWHPEFQFDQFNIYTRDMRNWIIDRGYDEYYLAYDHELHMLYLPNDKDPKQD
jgi:FkbM family methyltransferase